MIFKGSTDQIVVIRGQGLALLPHVPRCSAFLICLSYRLCPIRPCGAPSPRGEDRDTRISSSKKAAKPPPYNKAPSTSVGMTFKKDG